jgi:hypothetical protein
LRWCDNMFRYKKNVDCHKWADDQYQRCLQREPRLPFNR